jgi:hypothetical protein
MTDGNQCTTGSALLLGELLIAPFFAKLGHQNWQLVASAVGLTAFLGGLSAATQYNRPLALTVRKYSFPVLILLAH